MKKKLLFTAYTLGLGGIEKALINLLNRIDYTKYEVTLILEKKEGIFLDELPSNVTVLEYRVNDTKNILLRKITNRLKLIKWQLKLHHKYDFSCSFCTYSIPGAYLALAASKNNALWTHANYYILYGEEMTDFLDGIFARKFQKIIFVSEENKKDICSHYPGLTAKAIVCNNYIDGDKIIEESKGPVGFSKGHYPLLVNVGRHEEHQKRLSRIIKACQRLNQEGYVYSIIFVGDGPEHIKYQEKCDELGLSNLVFLGRKKNPYPYFKIADALVLSSEYEGYPVVFLEALVLNKPIISTKVSDWEELDGKYGTFCDLDDESVYQNIKNYFDHGFKIKKRFDYHQYNNDIDQKIDQIIND